MKKNRFIAFLSAAAMIAALLTGCGGGGNGSTPGSGSADGSKSAAPTPAGAEAVTIWYYWETEGHQVALDKVIQDYNASQDKYAVTAKYVPFADFKKQLSIGASADELPDIAILDSPDHASYAAMGIFEDITGKFDVSNYYEGTVNSLPQCQVMNSKKGKKYPLSIKRRGDICDTNYNLFAFQRIHKIAAKRA